MYIIPKGMTLLHIWQRKDIKFNKSC